MATVGHGCLLKKSFIAGGYPTRSQFPLIGVHRCAAAVSTALFTVPPAGAERVKKKGEPDGSGSAWRIPALCFTRAEAAE